ncbi:MAG: hypothetical protein ACYCSQ_06055 [bacterium]
MINKSNNQVRNRYIVEYLCNGISFKMHPINAYYSFDCNVQHPTVIWNIEFSDEIYLLNNESFGGQTGDERQKIFTKNVRGLLCSEGSDKYTFYNKASIPIEFEKDGRTFVLKIDKKDYVKVVNIEKDIYDEFKNISQTAAHSIAEGEIEVILNRLSNRKFTVLNISVKDEDMLFEKDGIDYFLTENENIIDGAIKEIFLQHLEFIKTSDKFYKYIAAGFNKMADSGLNCLNILLAAVNYELQYDIFDDEKYLADYLISRVKNNGKHNKEVCCINIHDKEENFYEKGVKLIDIAIPLSGLTEAFELLNKIKCLALIDYT